MGTKTLEPNQRHSAFLDDLKSALWKHQRLDPLEMLAIASQFVGMLMAFQDQRTMTPADALEMVGNNIEIGNAMAIEVTLGQPVGKA